MHTRTTLWWARVQATAGVLQQLSVAGLEKKPQALPQISRASRRGPDRSRQVSVKSVTGHKVLHTCSLSASVPAWPALHYVLADSLELAAILSRLGLNNL